MTGIPYGRLSKFESDKEIPTEDTVKILEEVLDFNLEQFYLISNKIDCLFSEFLDSLFYHDQNLDYFILKIKEGKKTAAVNYSYGKARLIEYIILVLKGESDKARLIEDELLDYFKDMREEEAILFQYKGLSYRFENHYKEALIWFKRAELGMLNRKNRAMLMIHSSVAYTEIGDIIKAMQYVESAYKIFCEYASFRRVSYCFMEYGLLLKSNNEYEKAIACFNIALKGMDIVNCSEDVVVRVYRNMCWTMILAGNYKAALEYLDEAEACDPKHGFTILYGIWCYYKLKNYDEAEKILINNTHLIKDVDYADIYELFDLLVKCRESVPSSKIIKLAIKIVDTMKNNEEYERVNFYIDIVLDLLKRSGRELEMIKYLVMKINLT